MSNMGGLDKQGDTAKPVATKSVTSPRLNEQRQKIFSSIYGDCWRACMASWLELPADVLPNDHSPAWTLVWETFLGQFGLTLSHAIRSDGPLWASETWVASVKSLNFESTHAILMHNANEVLFDPSTHKRYRKGQRLGSDVVLSGHHLGVSDVTKLHRLNDYRRRLLGEQLTDLQPLDVPSQDNGHSEAQS
jgi:hypothetical protein